MSYHSNSHARLLNSPYAAPVHRGTPQEQQQKLKLAGSGPSTHRTPVRVRPVSAAPSYTPHPLDITYPPASPAALAGAAPRARPSSAKARALHAQFQPAVYLPQSLPHAHLYGSSSPITSRQSRPTSASSPSASSTSRVRPSSATRQRVRSPTRDVVSSRPTSAVTSPQQPHRRDCSPIRFDPTLATAVPFFCESSESRLHQLHLQALTACQQRRWPTLVRVRIAMLSLSKLISGGNVHAPGVHLAHLDLGTAYLFSGCWVQAIEHCRQLPNAFARDMSYLQGAWDAHMLLARAFFGFSQDPLGAAANTTVGNDALPASPSHSHNGSSGSNVFDASSSSSSPVARSLARSLHHFRAALSLATDRPPAQFFAHTTVYKSGLPGGGPAARRVRHRKAMEAATGVAGCMAAQGHGHAARAQLDFLQTGLWDRADKFYAEERAERERVEQEHERQIVAAASASLPPPPPLPPRNPHLHPLDFSEDLASLELHFLLGQSFFSLAGAEAGAAGGGGSGEGQEYDTQAQEQLERAIQVARRFECTFARGMDGEMGLNAQGSDEEEDAGASSPSSKSVLPHPSLVHYPQVMLLIESLLLLAVSYARSSQLPRALENFQRAKTFLENLARFNRAAQGWFDQSKVRAMVLPPGAVDPSTVANTAAAASALPVHVPSSSSSHVSHASIDRAYAAWVSREVGWHFNRMVVYDPPSLGAFVRRTLGRVLRELVTLHLAATPGGAEAEAGFEQAAAVQEQICAMMEGEGEEEQQQQQQQQEQGDEEVQEGRNGIHELDASSLPTSPLGNVTARPYSASSSSFSFSSSSLFSSSSPSPSASASASASASDAADPASTSTASSAAGVYQLSVAQAHRQLGDIYLGAGQPLTALASYRFALQVVQCTYGVAKAKIHDRAIKHPRHSQFAQDHKRGNSVLNRSGSQSGFGSQSIALMRASILAELDGGGERGGPGAAGVGVEHGLPPPVIKFIGQLKEGIRLLQGRIRGERGAAAAAAGGRDTTRNGAGGADDAEEEEYEEDFDATPAADAAAADASSTPGTTTAGDELGGDATTSATGDSSNGVSAFDSFLQEQATALARTPPRATSRTSPSSKRRPAGTDPSYIPRNPHIGRVFTSAADQLSGASAVVAEGLALRVASAAEGDEAEVRRNAYDAFSVEKHLVLHPTPTLTKQQLQQQRASRRHSSRSSGTFSGPTSPNPYAGTTTAGIDFSKFGNLDLA